MAYPYKFTTVNTTNLQRIKPYQSNLSGIVCVNTAAYAIFVKLYWFQPTAAAASPTVGTTVPDYTFLVPALGTTTGGLQWDLSQGLPTKAGELWVAVTKLAADTDTTVVVAGDGIITIQVE